MSRDLIGDFARSDPLYLRAQLIAQNPDAQDDRRHAAVGRAKRRRVEHGDRLDVLRLLDRND